MVIPTVSAFSPVLIQRSFEVTDCTKASSSVRLAQACFNSLTRLFTVANVGSGTRKQRQSRFQSCCKKASSFHLNRSNRTLESNIWYRFLNKGFQILVLNVMNAKHLLWLYLQFLLSLSLWFNGHLELPTVPKAHQQLSWFDQVSIHSPFVVDLSA